MLRKLLLIMILFLLVLDTAMAATFNPYASLEFGGELEVEPLQFTPYASLEFGGILQVTGWGTWSPWWQGTIANLSAPTMSSSTFNGTIINVTWGIATNADSTYIVMKKESAPATRNDGEFITNTTAAFYDVTGLDVGTDYYFSGWSFNGTFGFSDYNSTNSNTAPGSPSSFITTGNSSSSISLSWTKGTNSTNTTVRYNSVEIPEDPNAEYPGYNDTGSSCTVSGLTSSTEYYFSAWGYDPINDLFSDDFVSVTTSTSFVPSNVTGLAASCDNHTELNLTWTKGSGEYTIIIRNETATPSDYHDGTEVYNGTGAETTDTGLNGSTLYYYGAWSWTGSHYSLGPAEVNRSTIPEPPHTVSTDYLGGTNTLFINWTKPGDSDQTLIVKNTTAYPFSQDDGLMENTTNATYNESSLTDFAYYNLYAYNATTGYYSRAKHVQWGAMGIDAYNESSGLAIGFNIFISDFLGEDTFEATGCSNTYYLDLEDIPYGVQTVIQISNSTYESRVVYRDLYINNFYDYDFYLPIALPPGGTTDPTYDENETYAQLYLISVINEFDTPVENATVEFRKYISATGEYQTVSILITDAMGQVSLYLLPETEYKVFISAQGYEDEVSTYIPETAIYTHTFRLRLLSPEPEEEIEFSDIITWHAYFNTGDNTTIYIDYTDASENTTSAQLRIYQNDSVLMASQNFTTQIYYWNWTSANHSLHDYLIRLDLYNHTNLDNITRTIILPRYEEVREFITDIEMDLQQYIGGFGDYPIGWINVLVFGIGVFVIVTFGKYWAGLSLIALGFVIGLIELIIGLPGFTAQQGGVIVFLIIFGALVEIRKAKKEGNF